MPEIRIERLGSAGDGIGNHDGQTIYVAGALPGELVRVEGTLPHPELVEIIKHSPQRRRPPCPHFGDCGGCTFQHASMELLLDWKRNEVSRYLNGAGVSCTVDATIPSPVSARRRVTFTASHRRSVEGGVALGFKAIDGAGLVNISTCTILDRELAQAMPDLRSLTSTLLRGTEEIQIAINRCDNGLDLDFRLEQSPSEEMISAFVRSMARSAYPRASINGEVVVEKEKPMVTFGRAKVALPPGGFLQAVESAEKAMAGLVCGHLAKCRRVADLFCGSGTFTLRIAARSRVHAVEVAEPPLAALKSASGTQGLKPITVEQRDLHALPLTLAELKPFDGLCLDPPRAGAEEQIRLIGKSPIRALAYVSCNPATLARDAAMLVESGFMLERVTPIDQFVFSPHIEVVALFSRRPAKTSRSIFR